MNFLLRVSTLIDALNRRVGHALAWLVLAMTLVSAGNALLRYWFGLSSNAWLELQWYLYAAVFLMGAGHTLSQDGHVRIDVLSSQFSARARAWLDVFGTLFFLLPLSIGLVILSWSVLVNAWMSGEVSSNAGGLIRWPARLLLPAGFVLLSLQGVAELIRCAAFLAGRIPDPRAAIVDGSGKSPHRGTAS